MNQETTTNTPGQSLDPVMAIIRELAHKSDDGKYIYRGECQPYPKVSSSLYRRYADIEAEGFNIEMVQQDILSHAKRYTQYIDAADDLEILSQLQHNGGETNLIDFTTDFLTALFFACDGEPTEPGRVILLSETGAEYRLARPKTPIHRIIAQKSVFVRPNKGFVEPNDEVTIPSNLKPVVLGYLRARHGISSETVYNDLHGFIRHQTIHHNAYLEFYQGMASADKGNYEQAIDHYTKTIGFNLQIASAYYNRGLAYHNTGDYGNALNDYLSTLELNPEYTESYNEIGIIYARQGDYNEAIRFYNLAIERGDTELSICNRGEAWLHLAEWEKARDDLTRAKNGGMDIVDSFRNDYKDVADFEQRNGLKLPEDIAEMLGG